MKNQRTIFTIIAILAVVGIAAIATTSNLAYAKISSTDTSCTNGGGNEPGGQHRILRTKIQQEALHQDRISRINYDAFEVIVSFLFVSLDNIGLVDQCEVVISIKDKGTGIDPDIQNKLFSKSVTKSFDGTGLGLYISKSIVEAHGGKIWAENNSDGNGATFTFGLPIFVNYNIHMFFSMQFDLALMHH
jgi:signal transduction histidine kinase